MTSTTPFIGIDFGTTKSAMAWYDPAIGRADIILNKERKPITPSVVYFDKNGGEILVGERAERKLEEDKVEQRGFVMSIKRNLVTASAKVVGDKLYRPIDVAAKILQKLREDAEKLHFHQPVPRVVITHPASFDALLQEKIKQAAMLAGFSEVELLPEPVAAALAYMETGNKVGDHTLVYDFGGGTFDVAVLARIPDGSFAIALKPEGLRDCGGDDLDRELYYYCEEVALQTLKRPISLTDDLDLKFLRQCRKRKENLSDELQETFSSYLPSSNGPVLFEHTIRRTEFESRIKKYVDHTVSLTQAVMQDANARRRTVDTVVLIGGSSSVPLVQRQLSSTLPVQPKEWQFRDIAVALGAAYHAQRVWEPRKRVTGSTGPQLSPREEYRQAVRRCWEPTRRLTWAQVNELSAQASRLGLSKDEAAAIEREIMGHSKEGILHYAALAEYRMLVARAWTGRMLTRMQVDDLTVQMNRLGLRKDEAAAIEREVMGDTKEGILARLDVPPPPPPPFPLTPRPDQIAVQPAAKWRFTADKIIPIFLILFGLGGLFSASSGGVLIGLILIILSIVWLLRKPKVKTQAQSGKLGGGRT